MKRKTILKRPKRKRDHLNMITRNQSTYQAVQMPAFLADDYVRHFDLTQVPTTSELIEWIIIRDRKWNG